MDLTLQSDSVLRCEERQVVGVIEGVSEFVAPDDRGRQILGIAKSTDLLLIE